MLDRLAKAWEVAPKRELCQSKVGEGEAGGEPVRLVWPQTFMNASGEAVVCLMKRWRLEPESVLIVLDDVALPLGMVRVRAGGSAGGHQGLTSVALEAATEQIPRLRVGIAPEKKPGGELLTEFVLGCFTAAEREKLEAGLGLAAQACETWVTGGLPAAMNKFNRRAK